MERGRGGPGSEIGEVDEEEQEGEDDGGEGVAILE